jgi:hypothetical protein
MDSLDCYKIGNTDKSGFLITKVFSRGESFIIYEIKSSLPSDSLRVVINPDSKREFVEHEKNYEKIKQDFNELKAILYKARRENSFKHLIAASISMGINGDVEASKEMLRTLKQRINQEYLAIFRDKILYSISGLCFVFLLLLLSYLTYINFINWGGDNGDLITIFLYSATAASLSGFISLALKQRKIDIDSELPRLNIIYFGIERILISVLSGLLMLVVIKSGLLLSVLNESDHPVWSYMAFSAVAGFSENYIPNILSKIEKEN